MLYSVKDREASEKLEEMASLPNQIKVVRLQDKLGKHNLHEDMEKVFEPNIEFIKIVSEKKEDKNRKFYQNKKSIRENKQETSRNNE